MKGGLSMDDRNAMKTFTVRCHDGREFLDVRAYNEHGAKMRVVDYTRGRVQPGEMRVVRSCT